MIIDENFDMDATWENWLTVADRAEGLLELLQRHYAGHDDHHCRRPLCVGTPLSAALNETETDPAMAVGLVHWLLARVHSNEQVMGELLSRERMLWRFVSKTDHVP